MFNGVKNTISNIFNGIKAVATNVWNGIKTAITTPIEKARDVIKGIIDKIKGFFSGLKLSLPHIKLPHFSIKGSFSLAPPSVPHLAIDWYKKAMDKPMILNGPPSLEEVEIHCLAVEKQVPKLLWDLICPKAWQRGQIKILSV